MSDQPENSEFLPGFATTKEYLQASLKTVLNSIRLTNAVPTIGEEYDYYNCFPSFQEYLAKEKASILKLMTSLVPSFKLNEHFANLGIAEQLEVLKDVNSLLFENLGSLLDEASGIKKPVEESVLCTHTNIPINASWNKKYKRADCNKPESYTLLYAKNIMRPQLLFKQKIDNSNTIFIPIIKEKPNAVRPLAIVIEKTENKEEFSHPYEWELERFEPQRQHLELKENSLFPKAVQDTPLIFVRDEDSLKDMCSDLKKQTEIAVDIEHHSYRSFQGFSCLIQISTRDKDYVVDALELRSDLHALNDVFTDPNIVKVLHGADMDVLWLQKDFGVYVVNMFDTGQAARLLNFVHLSLAFLMKHYCKLDVDKQFQLADWRIRPLPENMIKYAREDTHYLLYIYDCIKNDLAKSGNELNNLLSSAFQRSKDICLKKYEKVLFRNDSYLELYRKSRKHFNPRQLLCLKELYCWRDRIAREQDESYGFVLPNHMLLKLSDAIPKEVQGIRAICSPLPPLVAQNILEVHGIIHKALISSVTELEEAKQISENLKIESSVDLSNILQSPHDIHSYENGKTIIHTFPGCVTRTANIDWNKITVPLKKQSSLFSDSAMKSNNVQLPETKSIAEKVSESINRDNKTPYERYLLTLKFCAARKTEKTGAVEDHKNFIETLPNTTQNAIDVNTSTGSIILDEDKDDSDEVLYIRKKREKKKKRALAAESCSSNSGTSPNKKLKVVGNLNTKINFQPFDYKAANVVENSLESAEKKKKNTSTFNDSPDNKSVVSKDKKRKRKQERIAQSRAFNKSWSDSSKRKWPK